MISGVMKGIASVCPGACINLSTSPGKVSLTLPIHQRDSYLRIYGASKVVAMHRVSFGVLDLLIQINLPSSFFNAGFLSLCEGLDVSVHRVLDLQSVYAGGSRVFLAMLKRTDN